MYALLASPLAKGLFHKAWASSASPILDKTAQDAFDDNLVFVNNTGCLNLACLYNLSSEDVTRNVPWDVYPYWAMSDLLDLPEKGHFDGALPVIDGKHHVNFSLYLISFPTESLFLWAATSENVPTKISAQRRFRSDCAFAQSDLNLH